VIDQLECWYRLKTNTRLGSGASTTLHKRQLRCFGSAIDFALRLVREDDYETQSSIANPGGKIIAFLSGQPNYGPGALVADAQDSEAEFRESSARTFYRERAHIAKINNFNIDMFCIGLHQFHVSILNNLVLQNAGIIMLIREFTDSQLQTDLVQLIHQCMCSLQSDCSGLL
jgi:hypothetical protein